MKLLSLLTLFATAAYAADPPADAPLAGRSVHVEIGEPVPFAGRLLSDAEHVKSEAQCQDDHAFRKATEGQVLLSPIALVAIVAGALAVGAAVSAGVAVAVKR
jgi:hypothetical protein